MEPSNDVGGSRDDQSAAETVRIVRGRQGVGWVDFWAMSDVGMVRPNNEDQYLTCRLGKSLQVLQSSIAEGEGMALAEPEGYLMLVADGIGGAAGGERASALVVEEAKLYVLETAKWFFSLDEPGEEVRIRQLREALDRIDRRLNDEAEADPTLTGMGTTLTAASLVDGDVFIVHVGDSRAYLLRDGELTQLTRDHTLTQHLLDAGVISPEQAKVHKSRHVLTNALGGMPGVVGEIVKLRLTDGDRLLLCTDGLNDMVDDDRISELLGTHQRPDEACQALVTAALERGGRDNVTVIVAAYSTKE
jgi:serine/threonine protein phosphatase PrpC